MSAGCREQKSPEPSLEVVLASTNLSGFEKQVFPEALNEHW